ncbi:UDP-N-acetylglucosamine--N-acetylmuramyl-(pentapeptide) pyrophosphoryl-undecaprenol N-acetylglucosamine transferase [Luteococcus sp. Sow4_B9]|uniref:UDP-N-acetylglucosamine--N-acetylmuramyl- (pentapeptide) pyrophosphoryl-undecaprenol N-acetylglucosamine transferase n=1 Tax=Luteococcus sp. Sow4_B9 TaxID=3438792 RepID=UPI003F956116
MTDTTSSQAGPADPVRVVLAGGGTAGHIAPMIATAQALGVLAPGAELTCVGTVKGLETRLVPDAGLRLELIPPVPMPRKPTPELLRVPGRLVGSVRRAGEILDQTRAQVVVGFGGYVAMPVYLAARRRRLPIIVHEGNAVPGLANKVAARFATRVLATFGSTPLPGCEQVGMPVRREIDELARDGRASRQRAAREHFGLDPARATLLVTGGSQGARSINNATLAARDELLAAGVQILHVWGPKNFPDDMTVVSDPSCGASYHPVAYVDGMEKAYAAADMMVCRSGAGTVYEAGICGLPAVFVPLPHGNGEQERNATGLVAAGGGVLVPDAELDGLRLAREVLQRIQDPEALHTMARSGPALFEPDAAATVARAVLESLSGDQHVA